MRLALGIAAKYVVVSSICRINRHDRAPLTPVPADKQRAAPNDCRICLACGWQPKVRQSPQSKTRWIWLPPPADRSLDATLLALQTQTLDRLMSSKVADRIENARSKLATPRVRSLDELYSTTRAIWGEIGPPEARPRGALQREHARRLAAAINKPVSARRRRRARYQMTAKSAGAGATGQKGNPRASTQTRYTSTKLPTAGRRAQGTGGEVVG
jgi:hypothetical protein